MQLKPLKPMSNEKKIPNKLEKKKNKFDLCKNKMVEMKQPSEDVIYE